jgi:hypothetical protein
VEETLTVCSSQPLDELISCVFELVPGLGELKSSPNGLSCRIAKYLLECEDKRKTPDVHMCGNLTTF